MQLSHVKHTSSPGPAIAVRLAERASQSAQAICPDILLHLNVSVFRQLRKLGTSRERICAVLAISREEYDYVDGMLG